jgi:hypothetical protein
MDTSKPFAFVLLPLRPAFAELYEDVVRPAFESTGYEVELAGDVFEERNNLKDAVLKIYRANVIVADMTVMNPKLLYELGIAQGLLKPMILMTQRIEKVPFDLRSYRILEYSLHYRKIKELRGRLEELAEQYKSGVEDYANPVVDYVRQLAPPPAPAAALPATNDATPTTVVEVSPESGTEAVAKQQTKPLVEPPQPVRVDRKKIIEFAREARAAMDKINGCCKRLADATDNFESKQGQFVETVTTLRSESQNGQPPQSLRDVVEQAIQLSETYSGSLDSETAILRYSWDRLLKSATDLISAAWMESGEDREAAQLFNDQLQMLQETLEGTVSTMERAQESNSLMPMVSPNYTRSMNRVDQAISDLRTELTTGQAYLVRALNLLSDRLNAGTAATPTPSP